MTGRSAHAGLCRAVVTRSDEVRMSRSEYKIKTIGGAAPGPGSRWGCGARAFRLTAEAAVTAWR